MAPRILIVDDEPDICDILKYNLELEGYEVMTAEAPISFRSFHPDLILLDVMMTPISGFEWARQLKS
ncbi:MAG: response regulator, partial [Prevotella sp.]|nr:response regulator [Prevotella sp.]